MLKHVFAALLFVVGLVLYSGCNSPSRVEAGDEGSAEIVAHTSAALSITDVASVRLTITGAGIASPIVNTLAKNGNTWTGVIGHIPAGASRTFQGDAYDASNNVIYTGSTTATVTKNQTVVIVLTLQQATPPPAFSNAAPIIDSIVVGSSTISQGDAVPVTVTAHDPNGDPFTYAWSASGGSFNVTNAASVIWTAPGVNGSQTLTIQISDSSGATDTATVTLVVSAANAEGSANVTVRVNTWPVVTKVDATPTHLAVGDTTQLGLTASDADADPLTYAWSASCAGTFSSTTAAQPTFTLGAPLPAGGSCTLTVSVTDGNGGVDTGAIAVRTGAPVSSVFPPIIDTSFQSAATAGGGVALTLQATAHDPASLALTFVWTTNSGAISGQTDTTGSTQVTWTSAACGPVPPSPVITLTVSNTGGGQTVQTFSVTSTCQNCSDGSTNGTETDIDCGGPSCPACGNGKVCALPRDCTSSVCSGASPTCQAATCSDTTKNQDESDVDCGGAICAARCALGKSCSTGTDCVSLAGATPTCIMVNTASFLRSS